MHVLLLFPPLEQAPDQIASRPFETLSVIAVPVTNEAVPEAPTATLIPDGLDVTRCPLRPVALTVRGTGCPAVLVGVKLRVEENAPATPAELSARTRHQSCCAGRLQSLYARRPPWRRRPTVRHRRRVVDWIRRSSIVTSLQSNATAERRRVGGGRHQVGAVGAGGAVPNQP